MPDAARDLDVRVGVARLEVEQGAQQQQRGPRGPCLGTPGGGTEIQGGASIATCNERHYGARTG
jgi:hypothetical protein